MRPTKFDLPRCRSSATASNAHRTMRSSTRGHTASPRKTPNCPWREFAGLRRSGALTGVSDGPRLVCQHLTAWDLRRLDSLENRSPVLVCENPAVLEATAERFGGTRPVVCASGQPALVVLDVLHRLAATGVGLRYHGDFDWPGIAIANRLIGQFSVQPWVMTARDYQAACPDTGLPLTGATVPPSWDRQLGRAMERAGLAVHEEAVLDQVLDSLATDGQRRRIRRRHGASMKAVTCCGRTTGEVPPTERHAFSTLGSRGPSSVHCPRARLRVAVRQGRQWRD
jgi:hypothetical protein